MAYPSMENLLNKSKGSIYKLVILASKRVKELNTGSGRLVEINPNTKTSIIALREIEEGKVRVKPGK